jgi:hypothetical protein
MELSVLERAILSWVAERNPELAGQLPPLQAHRREHTGVGSYTYFWSEDRPGDSARVNGPHVSSPRLSYGGGSILWLTAGVPDCLEIYAYGDYFPAELDQFSLSEGETTSQKRSSENRRDRRV